MVLTLERQPLGQLLLGRGFVAPAQLETALAEQRRGPDRKLLGEILVESRHCSEEQIAEALAGSYGVPFARISPRLADAKVVSVLPRDFLEREQVLPLFLVDGVLTVAVVEPANLFLLDEIRRRTGHKVQPVAATAADIAATLRAYLPDDRLFAADEIPCEPPPDSFSVMGESGGETPAGATPASRLARACLYNAIRESATDIHVDPDESGARVRYRIDGRLVERMRLPLQTCGAFLTDLKGTAAVIGAPGIPAAGIIRVRIDGRLMELRLSVSPVMHGEKLVVRLGDQAKQPMRLEKLGFGYEPLKQWRRLIASLRGLLLVTGPAGSGKRTTLYSSVAELNAAELNVCTVEDRVGRALPGVNQFRVDAAAGYDRAAALRALLAQDPDVVMLPDTAEPEVARLAAGAAMAGRLVLCSVHAPDAAAAIPRVLALGVDPYVLGVALAGVLAQRLVRRLCPQCREAVDATPAERKQLERYAGPVTALFRPKGCSHCRGTGYAGRIALFELLIPGEPLTDALSRGGPRAELQSLVQQAGMKPLRFDGAEKVKAGILTLEDFLTTLA